MWNMRANGAGGLLTCRRALPVPGIDDRENGKSGESKNENAPPRLDGGNDFAKKDEFVKVGSGI